MAPLLRAGLHVLRCARIAPPPFLCSQRELGLLKPPESNYSVLRRYGESAALEEACSATQTANDTAGEKSAAMEQLANATQQECAAEESSSTLDTNKLTSSSTLDTDKLTSQILGKLRNRANLVGSKDNGIPLKAESTSSNANKVPEESSASAREDMWQQVMNSMRIAAIRKGDLASGGAKPTLSKSEDGEKEDDFADLDLPQAGGEVGPSKNRPAMDAFKNKDGGFQGPNTKQKDGGSEGYQQKAKEPKPVSFSFLKALDGLKKPGDKSFVDPNNVGTSTDSFSSIKSKDSRLQGLSQPMRKETKPVSFEFLKSASSEVKSPSFNGAKNLSFNEAKSAPFYGGKGIASHEVKGALPERQDRVPPNVNEASINVNRSTYPGNTNTVHIRGLPSHGNLALVKEALSLHGEVISSFKKPNPDGTCDALIEFKTAEAMDGALTSRWVQIDSKAYSIVRADLPITTVVRLSKVSAETTEIQLVTICEKFGSLDNIRRRGNGVYDVYYKERELSCMLKILDSLNEVTLNQRRWLALPAPLLHPAMRKEVLKSSEGQAWHASQLSQILHRIERGLDSVSVCFEDLKALTAMEDEFTK